MILFYFKVSLVGNIVRTKSRRYSCDIHEESTTRQRYVLWLISHVENSNLFATYLFHSLVGTTAWEQLISLYPYLVDCTTTSSAEVSRSLREALLQYCDLLRPPCTATGADANGHHRAGQQGNALATNNNDIVNTNGISHC